MGSKVNFSSRPERFLATQEPILNSLLHPPQDAESSGHFSGFPGPPNRTDVWSGTPENRAGLHFPPGSYSAAA